MKICLLLLAIICGLCRPVYANTGDDLAAQINPVKCDLESVCDDGPQYIEMYLRNFYDWITYVYMVQDDSWSSASLQTVLKQNLTPRLFNNLKKRATEIGRDPISYGDYGSNWLHNVTVELLSQTDHVGVYRIGLGITPNTSNLTVFVRPTNGKWQIDEIEGTTHKTKVDK